MLISQIIFCLFVAISGSAIACGFVAFITLLGVFEKLAIKYQTMNISFITELVIIAGVSFGNLFFMLNRPLPQISNSFSIILYSLFNLLGGLFLGCLVGSLAETLSIFPILSRRFGIRNMLPYILIAAAMGKVIGAYINLSIM